MSDLEMGLAYARGIEGRMKPSPDAADSDSAMALLRYAAAIQAAEPEEPEQYRPAWLWNLIAKLALWNWRRKYKHVAKARIREWYESSTKPVASIRPRTPARDRERAK